MMRSFPTKPPPIWKNPRLDLKGARPRRQAARQRDAKESTKNSLPVVPLHPAFSTLCHAACVEAALPALLARPGT